MIIFMTIICVVRNTDKVRIILSQVTVVVGSVVVVACPPLADQLNTLAGILLRLTHHPHPGGHHVGPELTVGLHHRGPEHQPAGEARVWPPLESR